MLPRHLGLLLLGSGNDGLGDLAWHWSGSRRRRSRLGAKGVFFRDAALSEVGFGGQNRWGLMEVVEWRVVGEVVWVEVVVVEMVVVLRVLQTILLLRWLWSSA